MSHIQSDKDEMPLTTVLVNVDDDVEIPFTSTQGSLRFETVDWIQEDPLRGKFPQFPTFHMTETTAINNGTSTNASGSMGYYMTYNRKTICHSKLQYKTDVAFYPNYDT
ncbi:hypothetical protein NLG97_g1180 [Lecanicillium saksenae]|uniref:Uncharacterized protein n=1 Tax=Lecanicillium saksenae TaxID=468837 RepID=A0ACC1R7R6_9HYPO|nr:hypothetical protein NLG97_g1180 [Lecanicillium saksenae]